MQAILQRQPGVVGLYRLGMKAGSGNLTDSAMVRVLRGLRAQGVRVLAYEPTLDAEHWRAASGEDIESFRRSAT